LSVFSTCVLQSVCVHTMDFVSAINKQIKINKKILLKRLSLCYMGLVKDHGDD